MFSGFNYKPYIAIIGDMVNSKKISDRNAVQIKLNGILNEINRDYDKDIASKFMITLGDEFQGLLVKGSNAVCIIEFIERKMYPIRMRFGIGVGSILTSINPDIPLGADGPAYHNARRMIDELKTSINKKKGSKTNAKIAIDEEDLVSELINAVFILSGIINNKWTDRQREIINDYLEHHDKQVDMALRLGINQSNVQKALAASNFYAYKVSMDSISRIMSEIKENDKEECSV